MRHGPSVSPDRTAGARVMRIALIHAVTVAMAPVHDAFRQLWPEAECVDILDTSLSRDRERDGRLTEAMTGRFLLLAKYAEDMARVSGSTEAFSDAYPVAIEVTVGRLRGF